MTRPRPRFVNAFTAKGKRYYYFRRPGMRPIRLPDFGTPEFEVAYQKALHGDAPQVGASRTFGKAGNGAAGEGSGSGVYFIHIGKFIKIGVTSNMKSRLRQFRTNTPEDIEILLTLPGDRKLEAEMHNLFADERVGGEFFRDCWDLREFIDAVKRDGLADGIKMVNYFRWQHSPEGRRARRERERRSSEQAYERIIASRIRLRDSDGRTRR